MLFTINNFIWSNKHRVLLFHKECYSLLTILFGQINTQYFYFIMSVIHCLYFHHVKCIISRQYPSSSSNSSGVSLCDKTSPSNCNRKCDGSMFVCMEYFLTISSKD